MPVGGADVPSAALFFGVMVLRRVDDRRMVSGIIYVIRYGLKWKNAPSGYGLPKTYYNRSTG